ncbi:MAG: hypothetical protein KC464_01275 [Myxococcales bacterium]|nr:hypothetical protein [Myxococcales bacterium]
MRYTFVHVALAVAAGISVAGCGDDSSGAVCGAGTTDVAGTCVSDLQCGAGTYPFMGECVTVDPDDQTAPVTTASPAAGRVR